MGGLSRPHLTGKQGTSLIILLLHTLTYEVARNRQRTQLRNAQSLEEKLSELRHCLI
jgi:hypothetical protein